MPHFRHFFLFQLLLSLILTLFLSTRLWAEENSYKTFLRASARHKNLHLHPQWLALLHMRKSHFGGLLSAISDKSFFLSPVGRKNPASELDATLESFFSATPLQPWNEPAQCVFSARYFWLKKELGIEPEKLKELDCRDFREWYSAINPHALTLIFPASFMNNPASAFGHTLLRIDQEAHDENTRLLEYAVNYAAETDAWNALEYAVKGVFGGYNGFFSVAPYYKKVTLYSDMESRDIWEYALTLRPEEVQLMTRHLWELRGMAIPYYYFDDNCSYQLLSLIEAARPALNLKDAFGAWVIPSDTIKALRSVPGLVGGIKYRPSAATKLRNRIEHSSAETERLAREILAERKAVPPVCSAAAMDLAYEVLTYQMQKDEGDFTRLGEQALALLKERSRIKTPDTVPAPARPAVPPDGGHGSARFSLGAGWIRGEQRALLELRPALHSLLDPEAGFMTGSQIEFLDTGLSLRKEEGAALEKFTLLNLTSLSPRNAFMHPISWWLNSGTEQRQIASGSNSAWFTTLAGGAGVTYPAGESSLVYGLLGPRFEISRSLEESHAFGTEARAGTLLRLNEIWSSQVDASYIPCFAGDRHARSRLRIAQRFTLNRDTALAVEFDQAWQEGRNDQQYSASIRRFF